MQIHPDSALTSPRPWYVHVWPWLLFGIPFATVLAGVATLLIAVASDDGLVADDYYKQGLAINRTLSRGDLARSMGLRATLQPVSGGVRIVVDAREGIAVPQTLRLTLAHPTRSGMDRHVDLQRGETGFVAQLGGVSAGHWNLIIEDEAQSWRLASALAWPLPAAIVVDASQ